MSDYSDSSDSDEQPQGGVKNRVLPAGKNSAYKVDDREEMSESSQKVMRAMDNALSKKRRRRPKLTPEGEIIAGSANVTCREHIKDFMDDSQSSRAAAVFHFLLLLTILASVVVVICNTIDGVSIPYAAESEFYFNLIFTAELLVRLAVADTCADNCSDPFLWVDAAAILPYWLEMAMGGSLGLFIFELFQALRILRLLKLSRHFDHETIILVRAIQMSWEALVVPFFFLGIIVVVAATMTFYFEKEGARSQTLAFPDKPAVVPAFDSIPDCIWFMLVTMTTVGYGDISPNTHIGKSIAVLCMIFGILFLAMPLSIVGNNFVEVWNDREKVIFIEKLKESILQGQVSKSTFQTAFDELDKDGSGTLSFKEFKIALSNLNLEWPPKQLKKLWNAIDEDKSGEIGRDEFLNLLFESDGGDEDDIEEAAVCTPVISTMDGDGMKMVTMQLKQQASAIAELQQRSKKQYDDLAKQITTIQTLLMKATITRSEFKQESFTVKKPGR